MRAIKQITAIVALWFFSLTAAVAQEDDKGFLTRTIQDALSGAGRTVSIDGFTGALSSTASFDRMTIADADGVWLTLENVQLDWNRSALLRGRLEVENLSAERLDIPRLAMAEETLPDAEAAPFSLPDLPVSIEIANFAIDEINLGAPLIGEAAQLRVVANARYTEDVFDIDFQANRTDGKEGDFAIKANLERSDDILNLLFNLEEGPEGIAARLMNLPGQPPVEMTVEGSGPLDDLVTDVVIKTDGQERLAGQITLGQQTPRRTSGTPDRRVTADIGGDITALLAPRYRAFFGEDVRLKIDALLEGNGAIELTDFSLQAEAAELAGRVFLNAEKWPTFIDITGKIANPDGTPIQLPLSGAATTVQQVDLQVAYDAEDGDALDAAFDITALTTAGATIEQTDLALDGTLLGNMGSVGQFMGDMTFALNGVSLTDQAAAEAVGDQINGAASIAYVEGQPVEISDLSLTGTDYGLSGEVTIESLETGFSTLLDATLEANDLSRFSAIAGRELDGQTLLAVEGRVTPLSGQFDLTANGSTDGLKVGIPQADAVLAGRTELSLAARRNETGTFVRDLILENDAIELMGEAELRTDDSRVEVTASLADVGLIVPQYDGPVTVNATAIQNERGWNVDAATDGPYGAALTAEGLATGPNANLRFTADLPDVDAFVEGIEGAVQATGTLNQTEAGWLINTTATGPYRATAEINGLLTPAIDVRFDLSLPDLNPLVPQVQGPLQASGTLREGDNGFLVDTTVEGPYGARAMVAGLATGPDMELDFNVAVPNLSPVVPGINGPLDASGVVRQRESGIALQTTASGPSGAHASVEGVVTGPRAAVDYNISIPNIASLVDRVNGPLSLRGSARKQGSAWRISTDAEGPAGTQATLSGLVNADGTLNLDVTGTAPLGLSRPFIAPRNLQGMAGFDLSINGPPALSSINGTVQTSNASLSAPNLRLALENIAATINLNRNRANIDLNAEATNGGQLRVGGAVTLTSSLPADLQIGLNELVLIDPRLYRTSLSGALQLAGPLTGGARISGDINVGETNVNVPSTGVSGIGDIPQITHIGEGPAVKRTLRKAGLAGEDAGVDPTARSGAGFGLDVGISAPRRIFVRGRGLDAELGGALRLTGTTRRIISSGRLELLRGRLDILGKRFDLVEGAAQFQGDLIPYLRFVSTTTTDAGDVSVIVEGPADSPEVSFVSNPPAPQDEVLAQLLFGRNLSDISAFQALQLANAVATLAGREGVGIISNLRQNFGLDDLDVTTTDSGETALRLGKYLTDNVYTDVTAASDGTGEVSLNIDLTPNLKGKATLGSDGDSGIGLFYERDY